MFLKLTACKNILWHWIVRNLIQIIIFTYIGILYPVCLLPVVCFVGGRGPCPFAPWFMLNVPPTPLCLTRPAFFVGPLEKIIELWAFDLKQLMLILGPTGD